MGRGGSTGEAAGGSVTWWQHWRSCWWECEPGSSCCLDMYPGSSPACTGRVPHVIGKSRLETQGRRDPCGTLFLPFQVFRVSHA